MSHERNVPMGMFVRDGELYVDYEINPLAIAAEEVIPFNEEQSYVIGRIRARTEEGIDYVNWYTGGVFYPDHLGGREIGILTDVLSPKAREEYLERYQWAQDYEALRRGAPTLDQALGLLQQWRVSFGL